MANTRIPFTDVEEFFRKKGWKLLLHWKQYRFFVKPSDPNEPPRWVSVDNEGYVDKNEFDKIKP